MRKEVSAFSRQRSAKKDIIYSLFIFTVVCSFGPVSEIPAYASDTPGTGTPAISAQGETSGVRSEKTDDSLPEVHEVQEKYAKIYDIQGSFIQKSYIKDLEETQEYSGAFFIKKPSQMMWQYGAPRDEKVIINDQDTWIYKKSQHQVIKTKFSKEAYSQVPIALLGSLENIREDFDIIIPAENALQLTPKRKTGFIKTLVLETAPGDMPITMFTIFDTYGNIIMIELSDVQINKGLKDAVFVFTVPPGAEVYDMSQ